MKGCDNMDVNTKALIANRLKTLRYQNQLSQKDVAEKLNVDTSTISYYENAKRNIPTDSLKVFASIYNTTIDEIVGEVKYEPENEWMALEKKPVPAFMRDLKLNILILGAFLLLFIGILFEDTSFVALSTLVMLLHGLGVIRRVFTIQPRLAKYYTYTLKRIPKFVYDDSEQEKKNAINFVTFLSIISLFGVVLVTSVVLSGISGNLVSLDVNIILALYIMNTVFLLYIIVQAFRNQLLPDSFNEGEKDKRMDTLKYFFFKGTIIASYFMAMFGFNYMGDLDNGVIISPFFYLFLVHLIHFSLYLIPFVILSMYKHYTLYK